MKKTAEELLHHPEGSNDSFELFSFNFSDKKGKVYGCADLEVHAKKKKMFFSWTVFLDGAEHSESEAVDFDGNYEAKKFSSSGMKLSILTPGEKYKLELKNAAIHAEIDVSSLFAVYDYPCVPDRDGDVLKHQYESLLWNRIEQRCKVAGTVKFKGKNKAVSTRKIDCVGQREKHWGERNFDKIQCFSRYMIQFREMSFSLTSINFGGIILSSGFMSKKSGNIPIDIAELEHIDIAQDRMPSITEISYEDSQEDKDLIVSNRLFAVNLPQVVFGKKTFTRFRNFSEYTIVGALKKGIGMEEHFMTREFLMRISSDK